MLKTTLLSFALVATVLTVANVQSAPIDDASQDDSEIPCGEEKNVYDGLVETVTGEIWVAGVEPPSNFEIQKHLEALARRSFHCGTCDSNRKCRIDDVTSQGTFFIDLIGQSGIGHRWSFSSTDALVTVICNDC